MNLTIILAGLLFLVAAFGGGYLWGENAKENEMRANYATQLETKIQEHNDAARVNLLAVQKWAVSRGAARGRSDATAGAIEGDIHDHPLPDCRLSEPSRGLLNRAVHDANDLNPTPDSLSGGVPSVAGTLGRGGINSAPMGIRSTGKGWRMP